MSDWPEPRLSPCCNAEAWDLDCDACGGEREDEYGNECAECDGLGYIEGLLVCSECVDTFEEE